MPGTTMPTYRVVKWRHQPALPGSPPPGPVDVAAWRLLWRVLAVKPLWVHAMARMLGLVDGHPLTMRQVADVTGYTGSRVGQVYHQLTRAAAAVGPPRSLLRALRRLARGPVRSAVSASQDLVAAGLTSELVSCEAIAAIATLWRLPVGFTVRTAATNAGVLVPTDAEAEVADWLSDLTSRCQKTPVLVTTVPRPSRIPRQVATALAETHHRVVVYDGVAWPTNHLPAAMRLAARALHAGPQTLASLQDAMRCRLAEQHGFAPPSVEVLRTYLTTVPWATVHRGRVTLVGDPPVSLSKADRILLDRLPPGETARWGELIAVLTAGGYSATGSANSALRWSPVVERTDNHRYHRRGSPPTR